MNEIRYTEDHEWVRFDDDGLAVVGITEYAQEKLGEIVFIELPDIGDEFESGGEMAMIESVKVASELFAPLSGVVVKVNEELNDTPGLINEDPGGRGWILQLETSDMESFEGLMAEDSYLEYVEELE